MNFAEIVYYSTGKTCNGFLAVKIETLRIHHTKPYYHQPANEVAISDFVLVHPKMYEKKIGFVIKPDRY